MPQRPWDGGQPVSARGRFYVQCRPSLRTQLRETVGAPGDAGDELDWLWLFPTTTAPGTAFILDGAVTIWTWPAGIVLADIRPIFVPLNLRTRLGPWAVDLPATFTALAAGAFA